jgi:phage-related protein
MATPSIKFDSVDLAEYIATWGENANARINAVTVPRRHGALITESVVEDARTINVAGRISADTASGLRDLLDALSELFTRRGKRLQLWDDRYIVAYKATFAFAYVVGSALRAVDFTLQFFCPDPFWYGTSAETTNYDLTEADVPLDITNNKYRRTITINNPGSAYIFPLITVTTGLEPLTTIVVRNITSGRYFVYTGTLPIGKALVIDMANFTVNNDGVEDLTNFQGDFFALQPGDNEIQIEGTAPANYQFDYPIRYN